MDVREFFALLAISIVVYISIWRILAHYCSKRVRNVISFIIMAGTLIWHIILFAQVNWSSGLFGILQYYVILFSMVVMPIMFYERNGRLDGEQKETSLKERLKFPLNSSDYWHSAF